MGFLLIGQLMPSCALPSGKCGKCWTSATSCVGPWRAWWSHQPSRGRSSLFSLSLSNRLSRGSETKVPQSVPFPYGTEMDAFSAHAMQREAVEVC